MNNLKAIGDRIKAMKLSEIYAVTTPPSPIIIYNKKESHSHMVEGAYAAERILTERKIPPHLHDTMFL